MVRGGPASSVSTRLPVQRDAGEEGAGSEAGPGPATPEGIEAGTYEILRKRLLEHGAELRRRVERLNAERKRVFGSIEFALVSTERITTKYNCSPRDMVLLGGDRFLFGYNVRMGLKREVKLEDVFAVYEFADRKFVPRDLDPICDPEFGRDFAELYKYYRETVFSDFRRMDDFLYMAFQVGRDIDDLKCFKWAVTEEGIRYLGNRFDHEYHFPPPHEFEWKRVIRDFHRYGTHPHISIEDRVFVETVGGDLTVKVEDNTETGEGIYSEPVLDPDQTLDDAEIYYAILGHLILMKIRPFQEKEFRYLVFNEKLQEVQRIDQIGESCVLLPDGRGIIFHNRYYLQTGEHKVFEDELSGMVYSRRIEARNGEDFLCVFYNRASGVYVLLSYNRVEQRLETPIVCNGFTLFDTGEMVLFKGENEPRKHHLLQVWRTPYVGPNVVLEEKTDSYLYKISNPAVVGCLADCHDVLNLIEKEDTYANL
ncbi:MAG: hypothetical protein D6679_03890 [Candidatus Hydrogenedentota bacterium]|nr:MAG: hypothetical protein D6679_03890 [Candidatus Hydrogenedentota bacterium]